jgi:hypothetical protein
MNAEASPQQPEDKPVIEWDGICVCGKIEMHGVRCRFGASHVVLEKKQ